MSREIEHRKRMFAGLNSYVTERGGWLTSIPGAWTITMECLPGSPLPDALRGLGWDVEPTGQTRERLLANAITEKLTRTSSGAYEFAAENSSKPVALRIHHAGFREVEVFAVREPWS